MKILPVLLIGAISSTIAQRQVACGITLTSPALATDYQPPNSGHIKSTKVIDCSRGSDRREGCL